MYNKNIYNTSVYKLNNKYTKYGISTQLKKYLQLLN